MPSKTNKPCSKAGCTNLTTAKYCKEHKQVETTVKAERDKSTLKVNELMYFKAKHDINTIDKMISLGDFGYCKYISKLFNLRNGYRTIEEKYNKDNLEHYLKSIVGRKFLKAGQSEIIDKFIECGLKARSHGIGTLNKYIQYNKLDFVITSKKSGNVRYWQVE